MQHLLKFIASILLDIVILNNEFQSSGSYTITINASNLVIGVYVYKLHVNDFIQTKKMIITK